MKDTVKRALNFQLIRKFLIQEIQSYLDRNKNTRPTVELWYGDIYGILTVFPFGATFNPIRLQGYSYEQEKTLLASAKDIEMENRLPWEELPLSILMRVTEYLLDEVSVNPKKQSPKKHCFFCRSQPENLLPFLIYMQMTGSNKEWRVSHLIQTSLSDIRCKRCANFDENRLLQIEKLYFDITMVSDLEREVFLTRGKLINP